MPKCYVTASVASVGNDAESPGALQAGGAGFARLSHKPVLVNVFKFINLSVFWTVNEKRW